jgi:hypothetical protein
MVLNEAPSEKVLRPWYSRLAQGRRDLSVSIEETLIEIPPLEEGFWSNDQSQATTVPSAEKKEHIFPPRLTLRSRALPGVSSRVLPKKEEDQKSVTAQRPNIWQRLVQSLASSFASLSAIFPVIGPNIAPHLVDGIEPVEKETEIAGPSHTVAVGKQSSRAVERNLSVVTGGVTTKTNCSTVNALSIRQSTSRTAQARQRLAGRTTRIRLEVVPSAKVAQNPIRTTQDSGPKKAGVSYRETENRPVAGREREHMRISTASDRYSTRSAIPSIRPIQASIYQRSINTDEGVTSQRLPAVERSLRRTTGERRISGNLDGGTTSLRLPIVEKGAKRKEEPAQAWRIGQGMFECGQRDVTIVDPSITASSVVSVMLTANPGPVVVQYISLQPRIGFTVHLTAPTTMGAPFNYAILTGK